jgi:hypothetical protein
VVCCSGGATGAGEVVVPKIWGFRRSGERAVSWPLSGPVRPGRGCGI